MHGITEDYRAPPFNKNMSFIDYKQQTYKAAFGEATCIQLNKAEALYTIIVKSQGFTIDFTEQGAICTQFLFDSIKALLDKDSSIDEFEQLKKDIIYDGDDSGEES